MFTGIITAVSKAVHAEQRVGNKIVSIELPKSWKLSLGESVNVNGVCSTVSTVSKKDFTVCYMAETLRASTMSGLEKGDSLNLERSLSVGDKLSGHFVYGHVDAIGTVELITKDLEQTTLRIKVPGETMKYLVYKGSVALNGVSLTVSKVRDNYFEVSLIPYTLSHTNLDTLKKGGAVNIETDMLAKYILQNAKERK